MDYFLRMSTYTIGSFDRTHNDDSSNEEEVIVSEIYSQAFLSHYTACIVLALHCYNIIWIHASKHYVHFEDDLHKVHDTDEKKIPLFENYVVTLYITVHYI